MRSKILKIAAPVVLLAVLLGLFILRISITSSIADIAREALRASPAGEDRVTALMAYVADEERPLERRNRAVWALGQLRDERALPVLRGYVKEDCRHGEELCQHELAKAIALCEDPGPDLLRIVGG